MATKLRIFAPGPQGDFACYTYDDISGDVIELAVGSLIEGPTGTATLTTDGVIVIARAPDAGGNQVVAVTGLTVTLPGGGPGNFVTSFTH